MAIAANNTMFSAATFYDVLATEPVSQQPQSVLRKPPVVAFYGFRGGAGRTLALAHSAATLARRGAKLALIDLDFEAPGLHSVLAVPEPPTNAGAAFAIMDTLSSNNGEPSGIERHIFAVPEISGELLLVPCGPITPRYLATIEELNVGLWHALPRNPLASIVTAISHVRPELDAVFVDCRTGFHGMTATALFHLADLVVLVVPLSEQIWDGVGAVLDGVRISRNRRGGLPHLLVAPAMVPLGEMGTRKLAEFQDRISKLYSQKIGPVDDDAIAEDPDQPSWLLNGVRYDQEVALGGRFNPRLKGPANEGYNELATAIGATLGLSDEGSSTAKGSYPSFDTARALRELTIPRSTAYAEEIPSNELDDLFINSSDYERIVDRLTALVIGAKGAGKTLLWRKLLRESSEQNAYVPGHGPAQLSNADSGALNLSADTLKELEQTAKLERNANYRAFWRFYALARIFNSAPNASKITFDKEELTTEERRVVRQLQSISSAAQLSRLLKTALAMPTASTLSERLLDKVDEVLTTASNRSITLIYDGLDTGFDVGKDSAERRRRFVTALLQNVGEARGRYRRVTFKVFLREDVWFEAELQNKSHLEAARADLVWRAEDLWRIALQLAMTSETYRQLAEKIEPGVSSKVTDESVLRRILVPLWGETIETGKNAITANYIQKRMSDAAGRLFPRSLVQLLGTAVEEERKQREPLVNRLLRFTSIREGMREASKQRVSDLKAEYKGLGEYLELLRGTEATGTAEEWEQRLKRKWSSVRRGGNRRGAPKGSLHAGRGWSNVIEYLRIVGVLGPYTRADRPKLQVALLYRFGLEVKGSGLQ